jgi:hypothetical protein
VANLKILDPETLALVKRHVIDCLTNITPVTAADYTLRPIV